MSLENIEIPSTVKKIESQCFYVCGNLSKIILKSTTPPEATEDSFGDQFSSAKLIVPKGTKLEYETAAGWSLFKNIEESSEKVTVEEKELSNNVHFSDGVLYVSLPEEGIGRLKNTVLLRIDDLTKIKKAVLSNYISKEDANFLNALASSYSLNTLDFTELKSSFGDYAFQGCAKLQEVKYSRYWDASGWYLFKDCSSLVDVTFPSNYVDDGIITFETGSFRNCSLLQKIEIPTNVTTIGTQCFYECKSLKNVVFLGSAITSIDKGAFEGCTSLESITLPSSMTLIGERCFEGCPNIKELHSEATTPPVVSESAFNSIYDSATLIVPHGCQEKYASAPVWKNFSSIKESEPTGIKKLDFENENKLVTILTMDGKIVYNGLMGEKSVYKLKKGCYILKEGNNIKKVILK